mgnify:CR=1 FL=1
MNITIAPPPLQTGNDRADIEALSSWCRALHMQLRRVLFSLDGENIASVPYDRITDIPEPENE